MEGWKETEIGFLPENWVIKSLMEVNLYKNKNINPSQFPDEIFEYYSIPAFQNGQVPELTQGKDIHSNKLLLEAGSIVFGKLNPRVEKVWRIGNHSEHRKIGTTEWITVTPNDFLDPDFLYFMEWSQFVMPLAKTLVSGSTPSRQRVDPTSFYKLKIPVPPLPEQRKITHILSTVQKTIEQQDKLIRTITELKKALMQKLFTEGIRGETQKETEIGLIPESWDAVSIEQTKTLMQYGTSVKCNYENEGMPVIRIPNVISGKIDLSDLKFGKLNTNELEKLKLNKGDLIFVRTNGAMELSGRCAIFQNEIENCYYASYLIRLQLDNDKVIPDFLNYYTQTELGKSFLSGKAIRTADGKYNINTGILNDVIFPLPTLNEQKEIIKTVLLIEHKISLQNKKKQTLTDLFKTLLHELMTGQRRVHEIEFEVHE